MVTETEPKVETPQLETKLETEAPSPFAAELESVKQELHKLRSVQGKELAAAKRELAAYKKASELPEDVVARLSSREEWLADLAAQKGVEIDLLEPYPDYRSAEAVAEKIRGSRSEGVKSLEEKVASLEKQVAKPPMPRGLPNEGGSPGMGLGKKAIMDNYIANPTAENRRAYEAIRE